MDHCQGTERHVCVCLYHKEYNLIKVYNKLIVIQA